MKRRLLACAFVGLVLTVTGACNYDFTVGTGSTTSVAPPPPAAVEAGVTDSGTSPVDSAPPLPSAEPCSGRCACDRNRTCRFTCPPGERCELACKDESTCQLGCEPGSVCELACSERASCNLDCGASGAERTTCTFRCTGNADCKGTCGRGNLCRRVCLQRCDLECREGATCR